MRELETRIVDIDVDDIREKLLSLGGKKVKSEDQVNEIYDFEDGRLLSAKGYARIRTVITLIMRSISTISSARCTIRLSVPSAFPFSPFCFQKIPRKRLAASIRTSFPTNPSGSPLKLSILF